MANILTQNPIIITSVMTSSFKSSVAATLGTLFTLRIEKIYWENATAIGHFLRIIDPGGGNSLAEIYSVAANASYWIEYNQNPKLWQDFRVSQLDSGTCFLYLRG